MKTKLSLIITVILLLFVSAEIKAQEATTAEIKIKTSSICSMCKETIETALAFEKGIKKSTLDVETKIVTVVYNPKKTTPEKIRIAVSNAGYDADEIKANEKAYKKLDSCCKKGQVCEEKK